MLTFRVVENWYYAKRIVKKTLSLIFEVASGPQNRFKKSKNDMGDYIIQTYTNQELWQKLRQKIKLHSVMCMSTTFFRIIFSNE